MPRRPRRESVTGLYHVMAWGLNRSAIFEEKREKSRFINLLRDNLSRFDVAIYAYCIMPNHIHLLVKTEIQELSSFMAKVLAAYAQYYNFKNNRIGYVFQDRFRSQCIEEEEYFWNCLRYIHLNPLNDRDLSKLLKYKFCSFYEYYYGKDDILCEKAFAAKEKRFQTKKAFLAFHKMDNRDVFEDVSEDTQWNNLRIAREVLFDMQWQLGVPEEEILEYIDTRRLFGEVLMRSLEISKKDADEIQAYLRKEIKGNG